MVPRFFICLPTSFDDREKHLNSRRFKFSNSGQRRYNWKSTAGLTVLKMARTNMEAAKVLLVLCLSVTIGVANSRSTSRRSAKQGFADKYVSSSELGVYSKGAVSANGHECAAIGNQMLAKNGSAVDAAISTLLCEGAVAIHSMGLGGGFLMTVYDPVKGPWFLDARETAPSNSSVNMFAGETEDAMYGGRSIAVPGELLGFWEAHQKFGKLPWAELFKPVIALCKDGFKVTQYLYDELVAVIDKIRAEKSLCQLLINPETNYPWPVGSKLRRPVLAKTLERIAKQNHTCFYNGTMGVALVEEIKKFGGIITMDDLQNYKVKWSQPITNTIGNMTMYTAPPPGSGAILIFIMNVFEGFEPTDDEGLFWHRMVETFKWAYARRTQLADTVVSDDPEVIEFQRRLLQKLTSKDYANLVRAQIKDDATSNDPRKYNVTTQPLSDSGTGNVCVLAPDGSAVAATSTINQVLGAMRRSESTGIVFNDEMDDFSSPNMRNGFGVPPSPQNYIKPGKRPLSSMAPTIVVNDDGKVRLIVGAAGGTKITTSVALTTILNLFKGYNIKEAIDTKRLHHQLMPMILEHERDFDDTILNGLRGIGHQNVMPNVRMGSTVTGIAQNNGAVTANSDHRRQGSVAGL